MLTAANSTGAGFPEQKLRESHMLGVCVGRCNGRGGAQRRADVEMGKEGQGLQHLLSCLTPTLALRAQRSHQGLRLREVEAPAQAFTTREGRSYNWHVGSWYSHTEGLPTTLHCFSYAWRGQIFLDSRPQRWRGGEEASVFELHVGRWQAGN